MDTGPDQAYDVTLAGVFALRFKVPPAQIGPLLVALAIVGIAVTVTTEVAVHPVESV